ncbi:MAG: hypothetical protein WC082_11100, partial [Victivallales bacterium]
MKKIIAVLLFLAIPALSVSCHSAGVDESGLNSDIFVSEESDKSEEQSAQSSQEMSEEYSPSSGKLEKQDIVKSLVRAEGEPEITLAEKEFNFYESAAIENLTVTGSHEYADGKLYLSDTACIQYRPKETLSAERMVIAFGLDVITMPEILDADGKFTESDDIFIFSAGDVSRWYGSEYDYAVRFRVTKQSEDAVSFYGYSKSYTLQDLA